MKSPLLKIFFIVFLVNLSFCFNAQEHHVIKVKKESNLVKAEFDNTELRLIAFDRFGNPKENQITSFKLWIKDKSDTKSFTGFNNTLSPEMIKELNKLKKATKIFFTDINAKEDDEHLVKLPDVIDTWFPNCKNCDKKGKGY